MPDDVPIVTGASGLIGRPQVLRVPDLERPIEYDENGDPVYAVEPAPSKAIPPNCLRKLHSPLPVERQGTCSDCPGLQRDGGCLAELVRRAQALGVDDWEFSVRLDQYGNQVWTYEGPSLEVEERAEASHREALADDDDGVYGAPV